MSKSEKWIKDNYKSKLSMLTVIGVNVIKSGKYNSVLCKCDCGIEKLTPIQSLKAGDSKSCGCLHKNRTNKNKKWAKDNKGVVFGGLLVLEEIKSIGGVSHVMCRCACSKEYFVRIGGIIRGTTKSCGCLLSENRKQTNLKKHGVVHVMQSPEVKSKTRKSKIKNGHIIVINGKTIKEIAVEKNYAETTIQKMNKKYGSSFVEDLSPDRQKTGIEQKILKILKNFGVDFSWNKKFGNYRPDFRLEKYKLIIECDGLYWHSDAKDRMNSKYHINKRIFYESKGYTLLGFYEDEIDTKIDIVSSIIGNKLGLSGKYFARKTEIKMVPTTQSNEFFEFHHLMGKGRGKTVGLYVGDMLVSAMRIVKKGSGFDISRFCNRMKTTVIGGFSKILSYIKKNFTVDFIQTFIDRRYGKGNYLSSFGFTNKTEHPSFGWVKGNSRIHRLNFRSSSGYVSGWFKLWDYGQSKWVLEI